MRVMMIVKANQVSEAGQMPGQRLLDDIGRLHDGLIFEAEDFAAAPAPEGAHSENRPRRPAAASGL